MGKLIQITGLPRSGTGFMSVFLSLHPVCVAYHELITKKDDYKDFLESELLTNKFVADCSTYGYFPNHSYPEAKKVFLNRHPIRSKDSANKVFNTNLQIDDYVKHLNAIDLWIANNKVHIVDFNKLFNVDTLKEVWFYCFDSLAYFSEEKVENLISMNIQMQNPTETITNGEILRKIKKQLNTSLCQQ